MKTVLVIRFCISNLAMAVKFWLVLLAFAILTSFSNAEFKLFDWITNDENNGQVHLRAKREAGDSNFTLINCDSPCTKAKNNDTQKNNNNSNENPKTSSCNSVEFNLRLSYTFVITHHMDWNTSGRILNYINTALNLTNNDNMSNYIRIIWGMQDGDLLEAISYFQQRMVNELEIDASVSAVLKLLLQGDISSSRGTDVLYELYSSERVINKNNALFIIISAFLNIRCAVLKISHQELILQLQNEMPKNSAQQFFIDINNVIWSIYLSQDSQSASPELFNRLRRDTINVIFKYEIKFTEAQCTSRKSHECDKDSKDDDDDDSTSDSDESDDSNKSKSKSKKSKEKGKKSSEKSKKSKEKSKKSKEKGRKSNQKATLAIGNNDVGDNVLTKSKLSAEKSKLLSKAHIKQAKTESKANSKSKQQTSTSAKNN